VSELPSVFEQGDHAMTSSPDDYYEQQRRRAATLEGLLVIARRCQCGHQRSDHTPHCQETNINAFYDCPCEEYDVDQEHIRSLERQLEDARYVGD